MAANHTRALYLKTATQENVDEITRQCTQEAERMGAVVFHCTDWTLRDGFFFLSNYR